MINIIKSMVLSTFLMTSCSDAKLNGENRKEGNPLNPKTENITETDEGEEETPLGAKQNKTSIDGVSKNADQEIEAVANGIDEINESVVAANEVDEPNYHYDYKCNDNDSAVIWKLRGNKNDSFTQVAEEVSIDAAGEAQILANEVENIGDVKSLCIWSRGEAKLELQIPSQLKNLEVIARGETEITLIFPDDLDPGSMSAFNVSNEARVTIESNHLNCSEMLNQFPGNNAPLITCEPFLN